MTLVIQASGVDPYQTKHHAWVVPVDRWPWPRQTIPVTVDRANRERIEID